MREAMYLLCFLTIRLQQEKLSIYWVFKGGNEHEDIVEEILWKHKIYSEGFMTATINQIKSLGIDGFDMKRFILGGYYDKEEDFLKRPLSIMKNDVWEQLNTTP